MSNETQTRAPDSAPAQGRSPNVRLAVVFPGQGAQKKGMGAELFAAYPEQTRRASEILGYSIEELCVADPEDQLKETEFTQPALYVVGALGFRRARDEGTLPAEPDYYLGHSLGEYNALNAAGAFDFETGLRLVVERGRLMAAASGGGMAAVVGIDAQEIGRLLAEAKLEDVDLANFNTPSQTVISGTEASVTAAVAQFRQRRIKAVALRVSAAFHSRYMAAAQQEFARFLRSFSFDPPRRPVIANATARPYDPAAIAETLSRQIASPVRWNESVAYLLSLGEVEFVEIGSRILTKMITEIRGENS